MINILCIITFLWYIYICVCVCVCVCVCFVMFKSSNCKLTIQILKVLMPTSFGQNPNKTKNISQAFDPISYNYWDYVQAWTHIFWKQNNADKNSWLIYFKHGINYTFSNWFLQWWDYFGPIHQNFPLEVQEGFQVFNKRFNKDLDNLPIELNFFTKFSLTWIFSWQYKYVQNSNPNVLSML